MGITFTKMHGAGNDFIVIEALTQKLPPDFSQNISQICDRHFGIGADQVLIIRKGQASEFRMDIFNQDGSQVEMCGNGLRCVVHYLSEKDFLKQENISIETKGRIVQAQLLTEKSQKNKKWVSVDMGEPDLKNKVLDHEIEILLPSGQRQKVKINTVAFGNPHAIVFVKDLREYPVSEVGSAVERHVFFPNKTNVEFVEPVSPSQVKQRTWERGAGETLACGSGACATAVICHLKGLTGRDVKVLLQGGDLEIFWDEKSNRVWKTGPSETVFEGILQI